MQQLREAVEGERRGRGRVEEEVVMVRGQLAAQAARCSGVEETNMEVGTLAYLS